MDDLISDELPAPALERKDLQLFRQEQQIGFIAQVATSLAQVRFFHSESNGQSTIPEELVDGCRVGRFVVFPADEKAVVGRIMEVKAFVDAAPLLSIELLGVCNSRTGISLPEGLIPPPIGTPCFLVTPEDASVLIAGRYNLLDADSSLTIHLGRVPSAANAPVVIAPEKIVGRHCAIVGTTGGGKSWTLARLVEECAQFRAKIILFDASGEYYRLTRSTRHVHIGYDPNPHEGSRAVSVPYYHLRESDLFAVFKPHGPSQGPKLREAMKSLKLARLEPSLAPDGTIFKAHRSKVQFEEAYKKHSEKLESPYADIEIKNLARQIQNECVDFQNSPLEPLVWGGPNSNDHSYCIPLINRIQDIVHSPNLAAIFNPEGLPSLFRELHLFLRGKSHSVFRISLKYLPFDHNAREIVANAVGRHLLELARADRFRDQPLVVVVDEAHQFLNSALSENKEIFPLDSFALIAKEGRKYAATICLATQRPRDIPEGVLSQMGTMLVHRLINDRDRAVVERACGELDQYTSTIIPTLTPGQAVLLGVDFPIPLTLQVEAPRHKPDSRGPDYQRFWR